jgi:hypothetical protein
LAAVVETAVICGLGLIAIFWVIPSQTSGMGLGLPPSFLPTVCAVAVTLLVLCDGVIRLLRPRAEGAYDECWLSFLQMGAVTIICTILFQVAGIIVSTLFTIPACMLLLGERRWLAILLTTAIGTIGLGLVFH